MGEILKVGAAAVVGSWLGGKIAPMLTAKFADSGSMSAGTVQIVDMAVAGLSAGLVYKFLKI